MVELIDIHFTGPWDSQDSGISSLLATPPPLLAFGTTRRLHILGPQKRQRTDKALNSGSWVRLARRGREMYSTSEPHKA